MNQMDLEVNKMFMREIGLEVGSGSRVIDQDTGMGLSFKNMEVVAPGTYCGPNTVEFDPHNNKRMMGFLFGYFLDKHSEESDVSVTTYYNVDSNSSNKSAIECKMSDMSSIRSKEYQRESLKCMDIIMQLNEEQEAPDLSKYDIPKPVNNVRGRARSGSHGHKSNTKAASNRK